MSTGTCFSFVHDTMKTRILVSADRIWFVFCRDVAILHILLFRVGTNIPMFLQ